MSAEAKAKLSAARKGRSTGPMSDEHKAKIAERAKERWAAWRASKPLLSPEDEASVARAKRTAARKAKAAANG